MSIEQRKQQVIKQLGFVTCLILICATLIVMLLISLNKHTNVSTNVVTKVETVVVEKEVQKEVVVEITKEPNYTYDELYCMAVVIYNEAGSNACSDEQREYVGYVVLNRVKDSRYPDNIRGVLEQPGQYEGLGKNGIKFANRGNSELELRALERAWDTAKRVLENRDNNPLPENVIFQAQFKQGSGIYKQIGNTYFCY